MKLRTICFGVGVMALHGAAAEVDIGARFEEQTYEYPQEKVYVHTDRNVYLGGDTIWMRGYVVDAVSHQPVSVSEYLYVEMQLPDGETAQRVKIRESNGVYAGYVVLPETAAEADYTLTAYTSFMQSLGEPYFFKKMLRVGSAFSTLSDMKIRYDYDDESEKLKVAFSLIDKATKRPADVGEFRCELPDGTERTGEKIGDEIAVEIDGKQMQDNWIRVAFGDYVKFVVLPDCSKGYGVTFHPEGGYLIAGAECRVAFKAVSASGSGEMVKGSMVDSKGDTVANFAALHAGMGFFRMKPEMGETYRAVCVNGKGVKKEFELPLASEEATVLHVDAGTSLVEVEAVGAMRGDCRLVVHERGNLLYSGLLTDANRSVSFPLSDFPDGVVNAVLFDDTWNPLSERLFFVCNEKEKVEIKSDKAVYGEREKVRMSVELNDFSMPEGNYSVSVTDNGIVDTEEHVSVVSSLLLSSEIKGGVENPEYYFSGAADAGDALDALLMTQGWRRYDIPAVVRGEMAYPQSAIEIGQTVSGTIKSKWRNKPEAGVLVNAIVPKYGYAGVFESDSLGRFVCEGFDFPENTTIMLQAYNSKGERMYPNFEIDHERFPQLSPLKAKFLPEQESGDAKWTSFVENSRERSLYNGMEVMLNEIIVRGRLIRAPEDAYEAVAYRSYDYKAMEQAKVTSVEEMLRKVPGLWLDAQRDYIFRGYTVALYVDNVLQNPTPTEGANDGFGLEKRPPLGSQKYTDHLILGRPNPHTLPAFESATESTLDLIERIPFDFVRRVDFIRPTEAVMLGPSATNGGAIMITTKIGTEVEGTEYPEFATVAPLGYQRKAEFYSPKYDTSEAFASTIPDLRPTLYWNPCVTVDRDGRSEFSFYTSDTDDTAYTVRVEGVTRSGEIIRGETIVSR